MQTGNDIEVRVNNATNCYMCGSPGKMVRSNLKDRFYKVKGEWSHMECLNCNLIWLSPSPVAEDIGKLYANYITHDVKTNPAKIDFINGILSNRFGYSFTKKPLLFYLGKILSVFDIIKDIGGSYVAWLGAEERGRLLDIGCGNGIFISTMKNLGWDVVGIEPDYNAARVAREKLLLDVHQGSVEDSNFKESSFDVITLIHVIEHLIDPKSTLDACRKLLKKNGKLIIITPNNDSLGCKIFKKNWLHLDPPRHLFLFSPKTLKLCASKSHLAVTNTKTTSKGAKAIWQIGSLLKIHDTISLTEKTKASLLATICGYLFWITETEIIKFNKHVGEEIVMTLTEDM